MTRSIAFIAILLAAGLSGVEAQKPPKTPPKTVPPRISPSQIDKKFIADAYIVNMAEVQLGELALQKAVSRNTRNFASRMISDHGRANRDLSNLAAKKNIMLPAALDAKHQAIYAKLSRLTGREFEDAYLQAMRNGHHHAAQLFEKAVRSATDADVRAYAQRYLPMIRAHTSMLHGSSRAKR